ncbi:MAG: hypothetical protein AB4042_14450 [Leptolyngbyaceae cyanobacterium]
MTWFSLFGFSLFYDTASVREQLVAIAQGPMSNPVPGLWDLVLVFLSWSITNIGLASCVSSMLGVAAQRIDFLDEKKTRIATTSTVSIMNLYVGALLRGFIVYLLFLGGLLVFDLQAFELNHQFTLPEYIRLVASISLFSFLVGLRPQILAGIVQRGDLLNRLENSDLSQPTIDQPEEPSESEL